MEKLTCLLFLVLSQVPLLADARTDAESGQVFSTAYFAFHSDFTTNLNDALLNTGIDRKFDRPELFQSGQEAECIDPLQASTQAGWNRAVDYYQEIVSPAGFNEGPQYYLRMHLAGYHGEIQSKEARQYVGISDGFLQAASPQYRACRWTVQDQENRDWIEATAGMLNAHEEKIAQQLEQLYQRPWEKRPIRTDIVETVSWSGANSIITTPGAGHLLISNEYQGPEALEIVFHEASHLLMSRNDPVWQALDQAADDLDLPMPDGLWHVVLFYTTGHTVKQALQEAGVEPYTPMIYGIYPRSPWGRYQQAMENSWPAYMDGSQSLEEAAANLVQAIVEMDKLVEPASN